MKNWNKKLFFLLLLGLLIRLSLLFYDYSWDVNNHISWAIDLWNPQRGFSHFYTTVSSQVFATLYPNYPPLAMYLFYLIFPLQIGINKFVWYLNTTLPLFPSNLVFFVESKTFLAGLMKLPAIGFDLGLATLVYTIAQEHKYKLAFLPPSLILFNPAFIFNSALWGQIDVVPIFFVVLATYALIKKTHFLIPSLWFIISLLIKPTTMLFILIFAFFYIKTYGLRKSFFSIIFCAALFHISFIPFSENINDLSFPFVTYYKGVLEAQSLPFINNGMYNFWRLYPWLDGVRDTTNLIGITYRHWGYLMVLLINGLIIQIFLKTKNNNFYWYGLFIVSFGALTFMTKMHERYTLLPLVFLLIASIKKTDLLKWFYILSAISFLNHYVNWTVPNIPIISSFLKHPTMNWIFSFTFTLLFCMLFLHRLRLKKQLLEK